ADAGETKLTFSGMETFGHDVYLIDHERNLEVNLQQTPEYTFTAVRPPGAPGTGLFELNDRFVLRMEYTGRGLVAAPVPDAPAIHCYGLSGHIRVRAVQGTIHRLEVYGVTGALLYAADDGAAEYRIPAPAGVYLVKVMAGGEVTVKKVSVK
ncbi:MAG: T9SS type A sorting domain-containing protein, partial [Tannerella sp.]|nr:T9SS type A sorting domain-containing protein [Tannerella sp.]